MKRFVATALVFLMTLTCAYAGQLPAGIGSGLQNSLPEPSGDPDADGGGLSIGAQLSAEKYPGEAAYGADFLNARLEVAPWPELPENGIPVFYTENDCLVLALPGEYFAPFLYNVETGVRRELSVYKEEMHLWEEMVVEPMTSLGFTRDEIDEFLGSGNYAGYYFYMMRGEDNIISMAVMPGKIIINFSLDSFVIDIYRGVISPADASVMLGDGSFISWLGGPDADYIYTDASGNETEVRLTGDPGYEYISRCVDYEWDTTAMSVYEAGKYSGTARFAIGFADGYDAGNMEFVDLGAYTVSGGPNRARLCGSNAALAYNASSLLVYPLLLVRRDTARALALIWDGETMTGVDVNELIGENGTVSMKGYDYRYLYPLDVSDDGRYAAFIEGGNGDLLVMDVETLETKCLMTQAEMDSMGYGSMMDGLLGWFVGDTIMGRDGYALKFVFD